ncbi:hypothetical protein DSO57_1021972 [Entomophthora muscae]|uniref:Uncharacterized protein n=1 Tax=Entomophthora muscae TaxID=34485 RepID=A0ACC2TQQ0_9FUNG|nr:hypothetical protein DSO57_1021972 [Entomophthora muscae]
MTLPLTPQPNPPMKPATAAETTSTQLFGVLYITLTGLVDSMVPNSGTWSLLGQSVSYIINLASILWWALPTGPTVPCPEPPNASLYAWLPDTQANRHIEHLNDSLVQLITKISQEHPNTAWTEHLPTALLILRARVNCGTGFSPSTLAFGTPDGLTGMKQGNLQSTVPVKPPLVTTLSLSQWCSKAAT